MYQSFKRFVDNNSPILILFNLILQGLILANLLTENNRNPLIIILFLILLGILLALLINWGFKPPQYPPEEYYVQDQLILSGPDSQIENLIDELDLKDILVRDDDRDVLNFGRQFGDLNCPGLSCRGLGIEDFVIARYTFDRNIKNLNQLIEEINERIRDSELNITVEPNWITGQEYEIEGGEYEIEGGEYEIEGGANSKEEVAANANAFIGQWAFESISLTGTNPCKENVRIGVFDTSPFYDSLNALVPQDGNKKARVHVPWVKEPQDLFLTISHERTEFHHKKNIEGQNQEINLNDHGLFVAGLIHAIAPGSNIELIQVLDKDKLGDLFRLLRALFNFMVEVQNDNVKENKPVGSVINLSLGVRIPPENTETPLDQLPKELQVLRDLLAIARCLNIVVVAAAGNHSANLVRPKIGSIPATWSSVIGVAASSHNNKRSCFSNQGGIAAPGGDAKNDKTFSTACDRPLSDCSDKDGCINALIGPTVQDTFTKSGFRYWRGTSFSAPLVSGLAALVLSQTNGKVTPDNVRAIIECGATTTTDLHLGAGIINIKHTLDCCLPEQMQDHKTEFKPETEDEIKEDHKTKSEI